MDAAGRRGRRDRRKVVICGIGAIAAIVVFIMSGHRSVYPSQVPGMPKMRTLSLRRGVELGAVAEIDARLARVRWRAFQRLLGRLRRRRA